MENKKLIFINESIESRFYGYRELLDKFKCYKLEKAGKVIIDISSNYKWIDANLLAVMYAYIALGEMHKIESGCIYNKDDKLYNLFIRNGFAKILKRIK